MSQVVQAVYENGVLRPLEPLVLQEKEVVRVSIDQETESPGFPSHDGKPIRTLHEALVAAGLLGCIEGGPDDIATNPKYMDGFGEHDRPD